MKIKVDPNTHKLVSGIVILALAVLAATLWYLSSVEDNVKQTDIPQINDTTRTEVTDFASCVEAGNPVMESSPEQCRANGQTYLSPEQQAQNETTGTISGQISYPSERLPKDLEVCFESVETGEIVGECKQVRTTDYSLEAPAGNYYVFSRTQTQPDYRAYYNEFVTCGLNADCPKSSHQALIEVKVTVGETTNNVRPSDWYDTSQ